MFGQSINWPRAFDREELMGSMHSCKHKHEHHKEQHQELKGPIKGARLDLISAYDA